MAKTVFDPVVGQRVYQSYSPQQAGIIMKVLEKRDFGFCLVRVRWVSGSETECETSVLSDFDGLIQDHERKLTTHLKMRARLDALSKTGEVTSSGVKPW